MEQKGEYAENLNVIQFYHPKLEVEITHLSENADSQNSTYFSGIIWEKPGTKVGNKRSHSVHENML